MFLLSTLIAEDLERISDDQRCPAIIIFSDQWNEETMAIVYSFFSSYLFILRERELGRGSFPERERGREGERERENPKQALCC